MPSRTEDQTVASHHPGVLLPVLSGRGIQEDELHRVSLLCGSRHVVPEEIARGVHAFAGVSSPSVRAVARYRVTVLVDYDAVPLPIYVLGIV